MGVAALATTAAALVVVVDEEPAVYVAETALVSVVTVVVNVVPKVAAGALGPPWLICPILFPASSVNQTSTTPRLVELSTDGDAPWAYL